MSDGPPYGPIVNGTQIVIFYEYLPSESAGYAFMALFAIATLAHLIYFIPLRAWSFIPFILGGVGKFVYFPTKNKTETPIPSNHRRSGDIWLLRPSAVPRRT